MAEQVKAKPGVGDMVASRAHLLEFMAIAAVAVALGYFAQHRTVAGGGLVESHTHVIPIYLSAAALDWLLALFVWKGIRSRGVTVRSLIGGRWASARDVLRDLGIAAAFWGVLAVVVWVLGLVIAQDHGKTLDILLPRTPLEVAVWCFTAATAGFCEELVFRGYVQRQLLALSGSTVAAVVGQGIVFGVMHAYQGWRPVLLITVMGILFGVLASWRKTLRVGMVAHGWQDLWAGWLAGALVR
jgi:membrane protease YdiL (CAAX protease family)